MRLDQPEDRASDRGVVLDVELRGQATAGGPPSTLSAVAMFAGGGVARWRRPRSRSGACGPAVVTGAGAGGKQDRERQGGAGHDQILHQKRRPSGAGPRKSRVAAEAGSVSTRT